MTYQGLAKKSYINGVLKLTESETIALNDSIPLTLGNQNFNSTFTFNGKLHDFRYYNYALTESEIQEIISHKTLGTETLHLPLTRTDTETTFPSTLNCLPFMAKDTTDYISIPYTIMSRKSYNNDVGLFKIWMGRLCGYNGCLSSSSIRKFNGNAYTVKDQ